MSKRIAAIPLADIERVAILFGNGRPMAQVKGDADYIMNAGFYSSATGKPVGHLKADGRVCAAESWNCWGFTWDRGSDIRMDVIPDRGRENYISGVELLSPMMGKDTPPAYNAEVGGSRPRTALALTGDKLLLYCADSPSTPEQLQEELYRLGAETALMLDGGGSSQCDFQGQTIDSSRRVHNYIAVWLKKRTGEDPEEGEAKNMKRVVLDPGHGVETAGKRSPDGKYLEHEFNLDMAHRLKGLLERHGVKVVLTREDEHDVPLSQRVYISNAEVPDLFVSLHSNASGDGAAWTDPDGYGIITSAAGETAGRNKAARAILARAQEAGIALWGGGLFHDIKLYVLKNTVAPAVVIEHGFHTNLREVELLKNSTYRDLLAQVDAKGILDYLGIPWQNEGTQGPGETKEKAVAVCPHCGGDLKIEKG